MSSAASEAKISCRGVWKIFGPRAAEVKESLGADASRAQVLHDSRHVLAVRDVSFDVREGETFVVMGLSGSGKSTLVRCISRLVEPTAGSIIVNGEDVVAMDDKQLIELRRHNMSMVFQHFGLFPHRRVINNIAYGLEVQGVAKTARLAKAGEVLEMVGLAGWEGHFPHQLSGGMQQRVGLARALAVDPVILLFDEPFSALDPLIRRDMQDELLRIQEVVHKTMIFITHDFLEAIKMGERIAIIKDGEFVQIDTPEAVVAHPADDYVRDFTEDVPRYKVLTARSVMKAGAGESTNGLKRVPADMRLDALIPLTASSDEPLAVVDADGRTLGTIDRTAVMLALGGNRRRPAVGPSWQRPDGAQRAGHQQDGALDHAGQRRGHADRRAGQRAGPDPRREGRRRAARHRLDPHYHRRLHRRGVAGRGQRDLGLRPQPGDRRLRRQVRALGRNTPTPTKGPSASAGGPSCVRATGLR